MNDLQRKLRHIGRACIAFNLLARLSEKQFPQLIYHEAAKIPHFVKGFLNKMLKLMTLGSEVIWGSTKLKTLLHTLTGKNQLEIKEVGEEGEERKGEKMDGLTAHA